MLRRAFAEGFGQRTPCVVLAVFLLVPGARFCRVLFMQIREFFFSPFFRTLGLRFPVRFFFSSFSFFFPLSSLGVGLGLFLFFPPLCLQDCRGGRRQVRRSIAHAMFFFFSSLCPAGPPLPFPFLSLSLSLSLACMHLASRALEHPGVIQATCLTFGDFSLS